MQIEAEAAQWLQRRRFWSWSAEDQLQLDNWLSQSLPHRVAYWRLNAGFERSERLSALQPTRRLASRPFTPKNRITPLLRLATVAVAAVATIAIFQISSRPTGQVYETQVGGRQTIVLTDGSKIDLNTRTSVRVRGRYAELIRGEAFFDITHNPKQPFTVLAAGHRITDLGTKFSVRTESEGLEVSLVQGRARIDNPKDPNQLARILIPGDVALATTHEITVVRKTEQDLSEDLGWRRGVLVFHQTTLADAAAEFNRYNRKKLVIADAQAATLTIGATFPTDDIEAFARTAKNVFGLHIEDRGNEIVISR